MTAVAAGGADAYTLRKRRRRSARRLMQSLTVACVLAGAGLAAEQFYSGGLQAFLDRPAGVGATPAEQAGANASTSTPRAHAAPAPAPGGSVATVRAPASKGVRRPATAPKPR